LKLAFAGIAALIHILFFYLEIISWGTKATNKIFMVSQEMVQNCKDMAFNQGFYNLFLVIGMIIGIYLHTTPEYYIIGKTLVIFNSACMFGAAAVLFIRVKVMLRGALIQGLSPLIVLVMSFL
jgi:putative membrane protein